MLDTIYDYIWDIVIVFDIIVIIILFEILWLYLRYCDYAWDIVIIF